MDQPFKRHYQHQHHQRQRPPTYDDSSFSSPSNEALPFSQYHSHPPSYDDALLDAFDKQLLSEIPAQEHPAASKDHGRVSLPTLRHDVMPSRVQQAFRSDLHDLSLPTGHDPTSPRTLVSSPTVAALQKRHLHNKKRPSEDHCSADGPTKRHHAGGQHPQGARHLDLSHAPPVVRGIQLICTSDMPDRIRMVFPYEVLNAVQSKCYHIAFESDDNLVVSAPTGSGKTVVMELAICRVMMQSKNADFKVIYQAPTKSLCSERYQDWEKKFKLLGLNCAELTGDTGYDHLRKVQQASIIITTPEKWDSITRRWRDNVRLVQMIKLFLVDEVHILKDQRGATLEAVVSRMKSIGTPVRFVALSATVPNSEDIATWLGKSSTDPEHPARREVFDESFRPVRLEKQVYGFQYGNNDFGLDNLLRKQVPSMIVKHGRKKPIMVFCMTRNSASQTARELASFWSNSSPHQRPWSVPVLRQALPVGNADLRNAVQAGVAFHHGGLSADDRHAVEQGFLQGHISVVCSTSTLAVGVNLPCYLVVLQGTTTWTNGGVQSYSDLEIMQMLGRAGRPQFEASACAVILTREHHVSRYQQMVSGQELLESTLHLNLIEHLNAEIASGTIRDLASAQRWLSSTFLRVRVARNSAHYRLENGNDNTDTDELMQRLCEKDVQLLFEANLIEDYGRINCTELGEAMAKYYVNFETMKTFATIAPRAKLSEILSVLTQAAEFAEMRIRAGEKSYYKELNKKVEILYPVNVDIALPDHKVSIILQAELGGASPLDGDNFRKHHQQHNTDRAVIFSHANRLIRCLTDCQIYMKDAVSVRNALELGRSIAAKAWECTPRQLKQLPEIGDVSCRKLASHGINTIEKLLRKEAHQLEMYLNKSAPFGGRLLSKLESFPRLHVSVKEMGREQKHGQGVVINIRGEIGFLNETLPTVFNKTPVYVCFMIEDSNGRLIDFRRFGARKLGRAEEVFVSTQVDSPITHLRCYVMCDEIVGTLRFAELKVSVPASAFASSSTNKSLSGVRRVFDARSLRTSTFDDDGIADDDLIAATRQNNIEAVDDIDEVLLPEDKPSQQDHKHASQSHCELFVDEHASEWIEPTQLPNGLWTCQHLCKRNRVQCKHKCCREGVAKPKKKPKTASKPPQLAPKQRRINGMDDTVIRSNLSTNDVDEDKQNRDPNCIESIMAPLRKSKAKATPVTNQVVRTSLHDCGDLAKLIDVEEDVFDDEGDEVYDAMDCDWTFARPASAPHTAKTHCNQDKDALEGQLAENVDDGELHPPHAHVNPQDIQLHPSMPFFVTAQGSSPTEQLHTDKSPDDTASNSGQKSTGGTSLSEDNAPMPLSAFSDRDPSADTGSSEQNTSGKLFRYVSIGDEHIRDMFGRESEEERARLLHEEDQQRRWDGLPQWMYDGFHSFTEIID